MNLSADEITDRIIGAVAPITRVLAMTWVHSGTGLEVVRGLSR